MKYNACTQVVALMITLIARAVGQASSAPATPVQPAGVQAQQFGVPATPSPAPQLAAPPAASAISQSGLLPLFAVDVRIDPAWMDGSAFPSASPQFPHNGVSDALQQAWDLLRTAGFNVIRFPTNVDNKQSVTRVANLCAWAKTNSVLLIPVLISDESHGNAASSNPMADFAPALITKLRGADGQQWGSYSQIAYYQISDKINDPGLHGGRSVQQLQQGAISAAESLRNAEFQALQGTNVQPTPIMVGASFDYELIRQGAINGVPLDASAQEKAFASLKDVLAPFAASPNIEVIEVEYMPRSISAGDVDSFASLLRTLKSAAPGKQLALTTGFSTAFHSLDDQRLFLILATTNLTDFRAADGVGTPFLGAIFREGLAGPSPTLTPEPNVGQWQWPQRANELQDMWLHGKSSPDLKWWLEKTEANLGLVQMPASGSGGAATPLASLQTFQQIASSAAQAAQVTSATQPAAAAMLPASPQGATGAVPASSFAPPAPYATVPQPGITPVNAVAPTGQGQSQAQQMIFGLLSQFTTQLTAVLISKLNGGAGGPNVMPGSATTQTGPWVAGASNPNLPAPVAASPTPDGSAGIAQTAPLGAQPIGDAGPPVPALAQPASQPAYVTPVAGQPDNSMNALGISSSPTTNPVSTLTQPNTSANSALAPAVNSVPQGSNFVSDGQGIAGTNSAGSVATTQQIGSAAGVANATFGGASPNGAAPTTGLPIPQILYFGVISNGVGGGSQTPPVVLQLTNPSTAITALVQAELRLDETSVVTLQIDPMLPKQSRSVLFPPLSIDAGSHTLDIIMTGPQGAGASATSTLVVQSTAAPVIPAVAVAGTTPAAAALVPLGVRTVLPGITPLPVPVVSPSVRTAPLAVVPPAAISGSTVRVPAVRTVIPGIAPAAGPAGALPSRSASSPPSGVRTIVPGTPPSPAAGAATPTRLGVGRNVPARTTTTPPTVRTIVPGTASSPATTTATPIGPGPRTVVPAAAATATPPRPARNSKASATHVAPASNANCPGTSQPANTTGTASSTQANKNTAPCKPAQK